MRRFLLLSISLLLTAASVSAADVLVSAAASLTDVMKEIGAAYEKQSGDHVSFNFAASSTLQRQIEEGAPVDLFISADEEKMNLLEKRGLIIAESRQDLLENALVAVAPNETKLALNKIEELNNSEFAKIVVADPKAVPAGIYAREYLTKVALWEKLQPRIIPAENVRAALAVVEAGNAEVGFVYKTDAAISKKVKVIFSVPPNDAPKISYPAALLKNGKSPEAARKFFEFVRSAAAAKMFEAAGFVVVAH